MSDTLRNTRALPAYLGPASTTDVVGWLVGLLDAARDRGDGALAHLIAGVLDDLRRPVLD